jgi:GntR family transcriptional regulator of arabinose operon
MPSSDPGLPKHRQVFEHLLAEIQSGTYKLRGRLPSEAELGKRFDASRITIAKAVNELQRLGLVSRRAGAGTYVLPKSSTSGLVFVLLIPDLGRTEVFEPICQGMMRSHLSQSHSLLWGHGMNQDAQQEREAEQLCHHYISQKVSGVFFAPLEFTDNRDAVNARIAKALYAAGIQIVLLDRCFKKYPDRSNYDLVGIDNRRTGYQVTQHLLSMGARRIAFFAVPKSAATVDARIAGYREALYSAGVRQEEDLTRSGDPGDSSFVREMLRTCRPEAIVCANDLTAARLMQTMSELGVKVPEQVRMAGIDDVKYASLLPVPLTTHHQNCADIGSIAMVTMLERIERPELPTRDILLHTRLVVRKSCGAHLGPIEH